MTALDVWWRNRHRRDDEQVRALVNERLAELGIVDEPDDLSAADTHMLTYDELYGCG